jgi:hypothetical protein
MIGPMPEENLEWFLQLFSRREPLKRAYSDASAVTSQTYSVLRSARRFGRHDAGLQIHCVRDLRGSAKSWQNLAIYTRTTSLRADAAGNSGVP